jgi:hypothetical protein
VSTYSFSDEPSELLNTNQKNMCKENEYFRYETIIKSCRKCESIIKKTFRF